MTERINMAKTETTTLQPRMHASAILVLSHRAPLRWNGVRENGRTSSRHLEPIRRASWWWRLVGAVEIRALESEENVPRLGSGHFVETDRCGSLNATKEMLESDQRGDEEGGVAGVRSPEPSLL